MTESTSPGTEVTSRDAATVVTEGADVIDLTELWLSLALVSWTCCDLIGSHRHADSPQVLTETTTPFCFAKIALSSEPLTSTRCPTLR